MENNPSSSKRNNLPVDRVSWDDCLQFVEKLNSMGLDIYRFPTEAEWEYACRAGTTTPYYWGDDLNQVYDYAWYMENSNYQIHEVGLKLPNNWGLYDMKGNIWEWCTDDWHYDYYNAPVRWQRVDRFTEIRETFITRWML